MRASDNYPELGADVEDAAKLVYHVYFEQAGTYELTYYRTPTLNEGKNSAGTPNACNTGLVVNGGTPVVLKGNADTSGTWAKNIMRLYEDLKTDITVHQGWNTIEVYRSSPSVSFDRILIVTEEGAVADSLVGPEESPNDIAPVEKHGVAQIPDEVAGATEIDQRAITLQSGEVSTVPSITDAVSAESDNLRAASVSVVDGKVTITAGKLGYANVTVQLADGSTSKIRVTVEYTVPEVAQGGAYLPMDGKIVIDAVDALEESEFAYTRVNSTGKTWEVSANGLQILKDDGKKWDTRDDSLMTSAPSISFRVKADDARYYLHVNTSNPDADSDSFHVLVNGKYAFTKTDPVMTEQDTWYDHDGMYGALNNSDAWVEGQENVITIVPREDGFRINQIVLTTTKGEQYEGFLDVTDREELVPTLEMEPLPDMTMTIGEAGGREVSVQVSVKYGEAKDIEIAAEADDPTVAEVSEVRDGVFTVTPVRNGETTVTVTASMRGADPVRETFTVTVLDGASMTDWAYRPNRDGDIIINAAEALQNTPYASYSDIDASGRYPDADFRWKAVQEEGQSGMSIQLTPVADASNKLEWTSNGTTNTPSITFKVWVPEAGDYYFSFFSNSPNANTDSFHLGVNGEWQFASKNMITDGTDDSGWGDAVGERWFTCDKQALSLNEGENTITIWGRESGLLRQIMLTKEEPNDVDMPLVWKDACEASAPDDGGDQGDQAYQPDGDGTIVIDAVDALLDEAYASHSDENGKMAYEGTPFAWKAVEDGKSLQLEPASISNEEGAEDGTSKWQWSDASEAMEAPFLTFVVYAPTEGDYYLSFYSNSPNPNTDSFHVGVDGVYQYATKNAMMDQEMADDASGDGWRYCDKQALHLKEGENTITIWARESGIILRQLMLSQEPAVDLDGWQASSEVAAH